MFSVMVMYKWLFCHSRHDPGAFRDILLVHELQTNLVVSCHLIYLYFMRRDNSLKGPKNESNDNFKIMVAVWTFIPSISILPIEVSEMEPDETDWSTDLALKIREDSTTWMELSTVQSDGSWSDSSLHRHRTTILSLGECRAC